MDGGRSADHPFTRFPGHMGGHMNVQLVYITVGNLEAARTIGRSLVEQRLAACVNIIDNMNSFYMWDGRLQDDREVVVLAKTVGSRVPQLIDAVRRLHSYEVPCIVTLPVSGGHQPFLDWIAAETRPVPPAA